MTIIAIWSVFLGEVTFCEFLVCFPTIPFLRHFFGELTELVFFWRIELRGLKLWWSGTSVLIRFWRLWLCDLFFFLDLKDECFGFHQCLTASQTFSNLTVFLHARLSRKEDVGQDVYEDQNVTADFQVCGFDWACRGWNFGTPFCKAHGFGPACDKIFVLQIAKFVVLTGPAADEILELHFTRLMVFAGPASDRIFVLQIARFVVLTGPALELHSVRLMVFGGPASDRIFVLQISRFVVLTGPAADEILELHSVRLMVLGLPVTKFSYCRLPSLWSWLGLLRMQFWSSILQGSWSLLGLPVTEFSYCRLPGSWSWLGLLRMKFWSSIL